MSKILECGSVFPGCEYRIYGPSEDEVLVKALEHAHNTHEVGRVSDALRQRIKNAIREDQPARAAG